jgi:hypothetical protein
MYRNLSARDDQASTQTFQFVEALWQLPLQYFKLFSKPSVDTLSDIMDNASWRLVFVQFLSLILFLSTIGFLGMNIPSATLHSITSLGVSYFKPLEWLPFPLISITLVLVSFFIGLVTAYVCSKIGGGQGTFLAHFYCLLVCTVPLVIVSGILLLLPATGWFLQMLGGIVSTLFIYRMVLHVITIMAVHRLWAGQAIVIVLILPSVLLAIIVIVGLFSITHGEGLGDFPWDFWDVKAGGQQRKAANNSIIE